MSVTRRGFLGIGAAVFGSALLPGKDLVPVVPDEVIVLDSLSGVLADLEKKGLRNPPREWHKLGEVFAEEIQATMVRPSFSERVLKQHEEPRTEPNGHHEYLHYFKFDDSQLMDIFAEGIEFGYGAEKVELRRSGDILASVHHALSMVRV